MIDKITQPIAKLTPIHSTYCAKKQLSHNRFVFISEKLTKKELKFLKTCCYEISNDFLFINIKYKSDINTMSLLFKIKKFNLLVEQYTNDDKEIGKFVFEDCEFFQLGTIVNLNKFSTNINHINIKFKYENLNYFTTSEYINYLRNKKLTKILK